MRMLAATVTAAAAVTFTGAPASASGFRVACDEVELNRSPSAGRPAKLVVKNDRTTEVEIRVVRNNGSEIALGSVKGNSSREVTTRLRYFFVIAEPKGQCLTGVRMTDETITIVLK